jgi:hypothetical protein
MGLLRPVLPKNECNPLIKHTQKAPCGISLRILIVPVPNPYLLLHIIHWSALMSCDLIIEASASPEPHYVKGLGSRCFRSP